MRSDVTYCTGVVRACLAAGPVFVAAVTLFTAIAMPQPIPVTSAGWLFALLVVPAIPAGGILAMLPALLGTDLLARLGSGNIGLRLPVAWGLVGGIVPGVATALNGGDGVTTAAFAATGAACALLCRSGTRWPD
jgi:hypothetical protein